MKGIDTPELYNRFADAVSGFPPTARKGKKAKDVFTESYRLLGDLAKRPIPRAKAWKAYALALSVYEGWPLPDELPEHAWSADERLEKAETWARAARDDDPTDYDVHWALADVYLIRKKFADAVATFKLALDFNRHERHPNLLAEAASAFMHFGDHDQADKHFGRAKHRPDWHRWMNGILLFMRAGRPEAKAESYLDLALKELQGTYAQPGQDYYQEEIQLVLALVHWKKNDKDAARHAIRHFRSVFDHWDKKQAKTALPFREKDGQFSENDKAYFEKAVDEVWDL